MKRKKSLPSGKLASKGGEVVVGGDGEVGGGHQVHLGGVLPHHLGGGLVDLAGGQRRGVDRHDD